MSDDDFVVSYVVAAQARRRRSAVPVVLGEHFVEAYGSRARVVWDPIEANVTKNGSNVISELRDVGTLARHAAPGVGPTWVASVEEFKDRPTIRFAGAEYLDTDTWAAEAQPRTVVIVMNGVDSESCWAFDKKVIAGPQMGLFFSGNVWLDAGVQADTGWGNETAGVDVSRTGVRKRKVEVHVYWIEFNGAASKLWVDGVLVFTGDAGAVASTSVKLGARWLTGNFWQDDIAFFAHIEGLATDEERDRDIAVLVAACLPGQAIFDGDSIPFGFGVAAGETYPAQLQAGRMLGVPIAVRNTGTSGLKVSELRARAAAVVHRFANPLRPFQKVCLMGGVNDISFFVTPAADIHAEDVLYANAAAAAGLQVYLCTVLKWASATAPEETIRQQLNALRIANSSGAAYTCIDTGANPALQDTGDVAIFHDGLHPAPGGGLILAQQIGAAMAA